MTGGDRTKTTVLLAEDELLFRRAIRELLSTDRIVVAGEASNGSEAVRAAEALHPDIAIVDVFLPLLNGLNASTEIVRVSPNTRMILLGFQMGAAYVSDALAAGVAGFVSRLGPAENLETAVRSVAAGVIYIDPQIGAAERRNSEDGTAPLTSREKQVVQLIAECRTTKEIAYLLGISTKTAESHRQRAMAKLRLQQPAQLVRYAIRRSLVEVRVPPPACRNGGEDPWANHPARATSGS